MRIKGEMLRLGLSLSILLICAEGTFAQKVKTQIGSGVDFSRYKTYDWLPGRVLTKHGIVDEGPEVTPAVKAAVNNQMSMRGFQEVPKGGDMHVTYAALVSADPQTEAILWTSWVTPANAAEIWGIGGNPVVLSRVNHTGILALNMIDPKTNTSLWAALCSDTVDKPADVRKKVPKAVNKAFAKFPVKPAK
jgi:Domain of unknown function (DUF4136)